MDPLPPVPLEYRGPADPAPRDPETTKHFMQGLFGGIAVSALAYVGGALTHDAIVVLVIGVLVALVKVGFGITGVCIRSRRAFGVGVLTSLLVGFMIFFGVCASFSR